MSYFLLRSGFGRFSTILERRKFIQDTTRCLWTSFIIPVNRGFVPQNHQYRYESSLATLRKRTGYAFSLCRKALEQNGDDLEKAEKWLRVEAAKQGWEKAERVKSRTTGQGLIGIYTSKDCQQAAMVEVKCETDFVARNENFIQLVSELARLVAESNVDFPGHHPSPTALVEKTWILDQQVLEELAGKLIVEAIQKLGENIRFLRACVVKLKDQSKLRLLPYTHAVAGKIEAKDPRVLLGKYGTIVAVSQDDDHPPSVSEDTESEIDSTMASRDIKELGSRLGQHIIGLSPKTVQDRSKPDDGTDIQDARGDEEPTALLKQKFIFNEEITVQKFLENSRAQVLDFVRFECGEEVQDCDNNKKNQ